MTEIKQMMHDMGRHARQAAMALGRATTKAKNLALHAIADHIDKQRTEILAANASDLEAGQDKLDDALLDRLELNKDRIDGMIDGLQQIALLPDPVGAISDLNMRPSGIQVGKMRVPLGVIGIIYESRPNVTADAAGLCLKSGNASILRGGSESLHSNRAIAQCLHTGLAQAGLPAQTVQVVETADRSAVGELITMSQWVDVIIPRGGKSLIERISREASIAVIKHLHGICHVYIDDKADLEKAVAIAFNAKTQRYGTCNTLETLLVAEAVAEHVLPALGKLYLEKGVELRGCARTRDIIAGINLASESDWETEYLAPILSIRVVDGFDQALQHIDQYGSHHTDAIVTDDIQRARRFLREVDSSSVMVNASTRFADGFEYGLGAEIGISTDKLHVRGPVGLHGLTTEKFVVLGDGHIRG